MFEIISIILAVLLLLVTVNSTYFFLGIQKVTFIEWIVFNACAPASITFLIGFVLSLTVKDRTVLHMSILPMFFFGFLGMFVFPWKGYNIIAQISHVIMSMNIVWVLITTFMAKNYQPAVIGLLLGITVFSVFIGFQQNYAAAHREDMQRILGI